MFAARLPDRASTYRSTARESGQPAFGECLWVILRGKRPGADLAFGSHSQFRAEVCASAGAKEKFGKDFVAARTKVSPAGTRAGEAQRAMSSADFWLA
jgi:catalase (peroxidase I)